jgi:tRNA (cytidine/uridine-2'-O-)-methyltransferase
VTGEDILQSRIDAAYRIPIFEPGVRSLDLANAVSIVLYEALRRTGRLSE